MVAQSSFCSIVCSPVSWLGRQTPRCWHWAILLAHGHDAVPPEDAPTKLPDLPRGTTGEEFRRRCEETGTTACERQREGMHPIPLLCKEWNGVDCEENNGEEGEEWKRRERVESGNRLWRGVGTLGSVHTPATVNACISLALLDDASEEDRVALQFATGESLNDSPAAAASSATAAAAMGGNKKGSEEEGAKEGDKKGHQEPASACRACSNKGPLSLATAGASVSGDVLLTLAADELRDALGVRAMGGRVNSVAWY
jgi:hypothetical protein